MGFDGSRELVEHEPEVTPGAVRPGAPPRGTPRGKPRKNAEYFSNNRERMTYPQLRAMGLCVASGVVEGGCKNIVGARLKQGGMRWTVDGANAIIARRCAVESNRFDDF